MIERFVHQRVDFVLPSKSEEVPIDIVDFCGVSEFDVAEHRGVVLLRLLNDPLNLLPQRELPEGERECGRNELGGRPVLAGLELVQATLFRNLRVERRLVEPLRLIAQAIHHPTSVFRRQNVAVSALKKSGNGVHESIDDQLSLHRCMDFVKGPPCCA